MPLKDGKKKSVILDHLVDFVDKLLARISDESDQGRDALINACEIAKIKYNQPIQSWFVGWVYQYSRTRGPDVDLAIRSMGQLRNTVTQLQEIRLLVSRGQWNVGSFNYYLLEELIAGVPGYAPLTDINRYVVIERVSELMTEKIDFLLKDHEYNKKQILAKETELKNTQLGMQRTADNILIACHLDEAIGSAQRFTDKIHFCIDRNEASWQLHWINVFGKAFRLQESSELVDLLAHHHSDDVSEITALTMRRLKRECMKALDLFFDEVQVLVNPKNPRTNKEMSNEELVIAGNLKTFVLRGFSGGVYSLCWINAMGTEKVITLEDYPEMHHWLYQQPDLTEEHIYQLRSCLLSVNTTKAIGMDDFKIELMRCLDKKSQLVIEPEKKAVHVNRLNLSLFAHINKCLGGEEGSHAAQSQPVDEEPHTSTPLPGKLNLGSYSNIAKVVVGTKDDTTPDECALAQSSTPVV